jgi:phosphatidylserine/phosphatidylglycerophosphate/cardiolipin synthase-like enzyme
MKVAIFDGALIVTGTANWTRRSLTLLTETVLEIAGGPIVGELRCWFDTQWDTRTEVARVGLEARAYSALVNRLL